MEGIISPPFYKGNKMSSPPLIFGPVPPYSNPPIQPQFYAPSKFFISNITLGVTTIVTTTANMNYVVGQQVRLTIPNGFGCIQLNEMPAYVISLPALNQVELDLFTAGQDGFIASSATTQPQITAIGDINPGAINSQGRVNNSTFIPGSFIDISPL